MGCGILTDSEITVRSFTVTFDALQFRSSTSQQNRLDFDWGTSDDGVTSSDFLTSAAMIEETAGDINGEQPVGSNGVLIPPVNLGVVSVTITGISVDPGESIFLRWEDFNNGGSDAALALDNFTFDATSGAVTGACCEFPNCTDGVLVEDCGEAGQTFFANTLCADVMCPVPTGACCDGMVCSDDVLLTDCQGMDQTFFAGQDCGVTDCPGTLLTTADWPNDIPADAAPHLTTRGSGHTATIRPAGLRGLNSGANFFNIQGVGSDNFTSFGAVKFFLRSNVDGGDPFDGFNAFNQSYLYDTLDQLAIDNGGVAGDWTITSAQFIFTQSNAFFTSDGGPVDIFLSDNDSLDIEPRTAFDLYGYANDTAFSGYISDQYASGTNPFEPLVGPVVGQNFVETGTGDRDLYPAVTSGPLIDELNEQSDNILLLVLDSQDPNVSATWTGQNGPFQGSYSPQLLVKFDLGAGSQTGACCDGLVCIDGVLAADCVGDFFANTMCDLTTCCDIPNTACCDSFGCSEGVDQASCDVFGGTFFANADCRTVDGENGVGTFDAAVCNGVSPCPPDVSEPCPGDANGDNAVTLADFSAVLSNFGAGPNATREQGDVTGDGNVSLADFSQVLSNFGQPCP